MGDYLEALGLVFQWHVLLVIGGGTLLGLIMGALPGLTAAMAIALLLPLTFGMPPVMGMGMLLGTLCGAIAGGSVSATLLNIPGTPSSVATTLDAFPMARRGEAGRALGICIVSSFIGGIFSAVVLSLLAPPIADFALRFGPAEYFALSVFGLVIIASVSSKSLIKGLVAGLIGLLIATIGTDPVAGVQRYTFHNLSLLTGVNLLPALIGLFAVSQVLKDVVDYFGPERAEHSKNEMDHASPRWLETLRYWKVLASSSVIGTIVGAIPGAGGSIGSFLSYDQAKKMSKTPEKFGTGHPEGIIASESSNNALVGGALIPMLTLGIPGEAATAVLMGGLMIQGISPGPTLFTDNGSIIYGIFIAFFVANIFMLLIQWFGIQIFVKVLQVPRKLLMALILMFCVIGVYAVDADIFNVYLMLGFGVLGYFLNRYDFGTAPVILGLILGPIAESNIRRALLLSGGDWSVLVTRPISLVFLLVSAAFLFFTLWQNRRQTASHS
ncbi:tripartite tricarboxylate transporter permease [Kushneria marisflavi]|uniref:C4-dicarboxylate ABC transporter permease n=1 Tax=Kushneria marisflavi TaxID=157779 RepID=A0A240US44_9GAMM|nr:tripartite tricarboxylate transporter permease [Kushneria marisflavi]ART64327.1 C4-dicarboxylate ABC transporter permease [Kushneria marisflavi]RKD76794.1 putative tricarboxylic transport membrane protein [Kushneria marisflavi]